MEKIKRSIACFVGHRSSSIKYNLGKPQKMQSHRAMFRFLNIATFTNSIHIFASVLPFVHRKCFNHIRSCGIFTSVPKSIREATKKIILICKKQYCDKFLVREHHIHSLKRSSNQDMLGIEVGHLAKIKFVLICQIRKSLLLRWLPKMLNSHCFAVCASWILRSEWAAKAKNW